MGGGSDQTSTTQSQQVQQLPPWINTAAQQNYAFAQNVATQPLQQYQGQMVANVGPQTQQAWNTAATGAGAGQDQYNAAQAGYLGMLGQTPQQVNPATMNAALNTGPTGRINPQTLASTNLNPYMSPYTSSVINATLPIMQQNLGQQQIGNQNQASAASAYGGSRQGVQQGVTQAQGAQNMAQMAAQLNQANFGQAQQGALADISNNLQAQGANVGAANQFALQNQANLQAAAGANQAAQMTAQQLNQQAQQDQGRLNLQAASGLGALGQQAQLSQARNFAEQMSAGGQEQAQAQNQINAQMQKFQNAWSYPQTELGILQSALGMTPYGQATQGQQTTQTQTAANPLGMAEGALGALGNLFSGGATSAFSGLAGLFGSDRRMKTDIAKVGDHPVGVGIYAYRYKGDPKSYPKVVGPMAEDVQKIAPHAVSVIPGSGGKRAINMAALGALSPPRSTDTVPAMLTPGEAVLNRGGADMIGRRRIAAANAAAAPQGFQFGTPFVTPRTASMPAPNLSLIPGGGMRGGFPTPAPGLPPGALSAMGPRGGIGALGGAMRPPVAARMRRPRMPQIRGALGG